MKLPFASSIRPASNGLPCKLYLSLGVGEGWRERKTTWPISGCAPPSPLDCVNRQTSREIGWRKLDRGERTWERGSMCTVMIHLHRVWTDWLLQVTRSPQKQKKKQRKMSIPTTCLLYSSVRIQYVVRMIHPSSVDPDRLLQVTRVRMQRKCLWDRTSMNLKSSRIDRSSSRETVSKNTEETEDYRLSPQMSDRDQERITFAVMHFELTHCKIVGMIVEPL